MNISSSSSYDKILERIRQYRPHASLERKKDVSDTVLNRIDMEKFAEGREEFRLKQREIRAQEAERIANLEAVESIRRVDVKQTNYEKYFSFIEESDELSAEEKERLQWAINHSTRRPSSFSEDEMIMHIEQARLELQVILKHILPESLQEEMDLAIQAFVKDEKEYRKERLVAFYQDVYEMNKSRPEAPFQDSDSARVAYQRLMGIEDGTHWTYGYYKTFEQAFANVLNQSSSSLVRTYEEVLDLYYQTEKQKSGAYWDSHTSGRVQGFIAQLERRWNETMYTFAELQGFRTGADSRAFIDMKI